MPVIDWSVGSHAHGSEPEYCKELVLYTNEHSLSVSILSEPPSCMPHLPNGESVGTGNLVSVFHVGRMRKAQEFWIQIVPRVQKGSSGLLMAVYASQDTTRWTTDLVSFVHQEPLHSMDVLSLLRMLRKSLQQQSPSALKGMKCPSGEVINKSIFPMSGMPREVPFLIRFPTSVLILSQAAPS